MKVESDQIISEKMASEVRLSIIIPVYNNVNFTKSAVKDLMQLPKDCEIVIVDNASTDDTAETIFGLMDEASSEQATLKYISCHKNLGFGRANNKGYKHSQGKHVLFLNNDIRVRENFTDWIDPLITICEAGNLVSGNGGLLDENFNFICETDKVVDSKFFYLSGWCLAGSRETFDKLILNHFCDDMTDEIKEGRAWGPWNEKFFAYFEDDDLSWRARNMGVGLEVLQVPVTHFGRMTSKKLDLSSMYKTSKAIFTEMWKDKV